MEEDSAMARLLGALTVATMLAARRDRRHAVPALGVDGRLVGMVVASAA